MNLINFKNFKNLKKLMLPAMLSVFVFFLISVPDSAAALDESSLPDKATLSANRMRFDSKTGDFLADGNVIIQAGGLTVTAPRGTGNVERQEVIFDEGIVASGDWLGDRVDLKAGKLALSFADTPSCRLTGGVKGGVGTMRLDADRLTLIGRGGFSDAGPKDRQTKFWLVNARRLEDRSAGITFGANSIEGVMQGGEVRTMTAKKDVWLRGRPKGQNEPVNLRSNHALYSVDRGSVVLSGNVSAVQGGRTLKSDSLVYFPTQDRVEAIGGVSSQKGKTSTKRAEITIDLSRENISRGQSDKSPDTQTKQSAEKSQSQTQKQTQPRTQTKKQKGKSR